MHHVKPYALNMYTRKPCGHSIRRGNHLARCTASNPSPCICMPSGPASVAPAEVTCTAGCTCEASVFDGHWEYRNSQLQQHAFSVSQSKACTVQIKVLPATQSGEHKVKVGAPFHTQGLQGLIQMIFQGILNL